MLTRPRPVLTAPVCDPSDPQQLIDQSIKLLALSIRLQLDAKDAIDVGPAPPQPPAGPVITVTAGMSLPSVLAQLAGGELVAVSPDVWTVVSDLAITKPCTLLGAAISGRVDIQAPDVRLLGCSVIGPDANGAVLSTGERLTVQGCRVQGSMAGQHRGIWVRSADVRIVDTSVVGIVKSDQETQAIAGWTGIKRLLVERCLLEAGGINMLIGGADCAQADIPEDVTVRSCYLRKPNEWRGHSSAKNLFEVKNCRKLTLESCRLEYSWVEGQTGYGVLLTVRNQDGSAPWSTIEDITIRKNLVRHTAAGMQLLGRDYTNPSQVMRRVLIEDNTFEDISPTWGGNQRVLQLSHGGEDVTLRRNHFSGSDINSFMSFEAEPWVRLTVEGNTFPEGAYGIRADDTSLGTPTLDKYAPACSWRENTVVRTNASNNIPYPPGTTVIPATGRAHDVSVHHPRSRRQSSRRHPHPRHRS